MTGKSVFELSTPAVLIDTDILRQNLERGAAIARRAGKKLRPHIKAHKIPQFAQLQMELGANGICAAKVSEAEVMADAGIRDIMVANEIVSPEKLVRLAALARRVKVTVLADSRETVALLADAAVTGGVTFDVMVEIDTGDERCGAQPGDVPALARQIAACPSLHFAGLETFGGSVFHCESAAEEQLRAPALARLLEHVKRDVEAEGLRVEEVSVGGSPALELLAQQPVITELRPGVYIFNDGATVCRGGAAFENCAATVLTTVISIPSPHRMVVDGGAKTFSYCRPGIVYGHKILHGVLRQDTRICLTSLSEEHGVFATAPGEPDFSSYHVGDKIEVIPAHTCPVINLADRVYLCKNKVVQSELPVAARGKTE